MSTKMERRLILRKKRKYDDTPLKLSKSISDTTQTRKSDFKSESLSSSINVDINSEKKYLKKKIRSTLDFNQLNSSFTSQDSEEPTKSKTKKTKKSTKIYNLPRISRVAEDFSAKPRNIFSDDELVLKKRTKRKSRKAPSDSHCEDNRKDDYKNKVVNGSDENLEGLSKLQPKENIEEDLSTEEYQSASSIISDEEIVIKNKSKSKKKKRNNNIDEKKYTTEKYAKRIRKLLSDSLIRNSKSNNTSDASSLSTPLSEKMEQNKTPSRKQIKPEITPNIVRRTVGGVCGDNQETGRQSASARLSRRINSTPYPKTEISNSPCVHLKTKEKQLSTIIQRRTNLSENILPKAESSAKVKNKNSGKINTVTVNVSFDMDFDSDDVFCNSFERKYNDNLHSNSNLQGHENDAFLNNNSNIQRKSVRFQSPEQNIRRETLVLSKPTTKSMNIIPDKRSDDDTGLVQDLSGRHQSSTTESNGTFEMTSPTVSEQNIRKETLFLSKLTESMNIVPDKRSDDDTTLVQDLSERRQSSTTTRNSTFEITSPKVINQVLCIPERHQSVSQNQISVSINKSLNTSKLPKKKYSTELLSPINKNRKSKNENGNITMSNSIIDLTTPVLFRTIDPEVTYSSEKVNNDSFCRNNLESKNIGEDNVSVIPNLVRTATFTKEDDTVKQSGDLPLDLSYSSSPLPSKTYCDQIQDTSKVNKRRRWDKSRLSTSFLDNSLDIANMSAPWQKDSINNWSSLEASTNEQSLELKRSFKIKDLIKKKVSFRTCPTPPSGTSTPLAKGKSNLLRQALLKDKQNVTVNESKNRTAHNEKPLSKVTRTKIPNFALIHQRAYDKLENILEMSERKALRAKLLLSGQKPPSENVSKQSTRRKELKFSPAPLKSSSSNESKNIDSSLNKSNILITKVKKLSPSKSNIKVADKENRLIPIPIQKKKELLKAKSLIAKPKVHNTVVAEKKGYTRFGFKIGSEGANKNISKAEQLKAVASKSKIVKNTVDDRRNIIQGVRSNRRFELLMNMRMK